MRFVRSPVAAGKIKNIEAPDGAMVITAADLKGVKPITPMLHKFNYKPVGQPILADGASALRRRSRSPPWSRRARKQPRTSPIWSKLSIDETTPLIDAA